MNFKYKSVFWFCVLAYTFCLFSCQQENILSDVSTCKKIEKYPCLFSYKTDSLRIALQSKAPISLVKSQLDVLFTKDAFNNKDYTAQLFYGGEFDIFPVSKVIFSKSSVGIYLVKEIKGQFPFESDMISLVIYDNDKKPVDILNVNLQNPFGTKEVNFISPAEFEVLWIDDEYSPDAESEAEDIKKGYTPVPVLITTVYKIDTLELKFIEEKR